MKIIVKKFGGSSLSSIKHIELVAQRIIEDKIDDQQIVVVVSAMGKTTNELHKMAHQITQNPSPRELDMLLTAGERITMSLLSITLQNLGYDSISFTGSQSGILTNLNHGNARISDVKAFRIREELQKNKIVIVAGFQGVSSIKEVTTLGRGGSDTTAVALAGYLAAQKCEIYSDVEGIFSIDPNISKNPRKLNHISYTMALFLSYSGAKIIHPRAVEFGQRYNITILLKSTFNTKIGTTINTEENMEEKKILAITSTNNLLEYKLQNSNEILHNLNHLNIFDYEINADITLLVENKDSKNFEKIIEQKSIDQINQSKPMSVITLVGYKIGEDLSLVDEIVKFISFQEVKVDKIKKYESGIRIHILKGNCDKILDRLHKKFMEKK